MKDKPKEYLRGVKTGMSAVYLWKDSYRNWRDYGFNADRLEMYALRREAALERALATANRRAERAEAELKSLKREYITATDEKGVLWKWYKQ